MLMEKNAKPIVLEEETASPTIELLKFILEFFSVVTGYHLLLHHSPKISIFPLYHVVEYRLGMMTSYYQRW